MLMNSLLRVSLRDATDFCFRAPEFVRLDVAVIVLSGTGLAQFSSSIEGTVTRPDRLPRAGRSIRVVNELTGVASTTRTSGTGYYLVPALPVGRYRVEASKEGFSTAIQRDVVLESARVQSVPLQLAIGAVSTQVTVDAAPPAVETSEARVSEVTTGRR